MYLKQYKAKAPTKNETILLSSSSINLSLTRVQGCEFCDELADIRSSRFGRIYANKISSRIVAKRNDLVAIPTLGQLFKGSLLILPIQHFETMAELPNSMLETLARLLTELEMRIRPLGRPILFEHGARCHTNRGCGIYHAHIHLVPVPKAVSYRTFLPATAQLSLNLPEALQTLKECDHYLLFRDTIGKIAYYEPEEYPSQEAYNSQYFRRALVSYFQLKRPWDWREYSQPEPLVFDTLKWFDRKGSSV